MLGNRGGDFDFANRCECVVETACGECAFGIGLVFDPRFIAVALDAPAGFFLHRFEPRVDHFLTAFGADFGGVGLEGHVGETLAVDAAEIGLIGVEVGWAKQFARESAAGDGLEIAAWWIDLDGFFFDKLLTQIGVPKMAHRFLARDKQRAVDFAVEEWRV